MATNRFKVEVWNRSTKLPASGVRVEALDMRGRIPDVVAVAVSDLHGAAEVAVTDELLDEIFGSVPALLTFRLSTLVSSSMVVVGVAENVIRWNARGSGAARIEVDTAKPGGVLAAATYTVEGVVVDMPAGTPRAGAVVTVRKRALRTASLDEDLLATSAATGANGRFRITYNPQATSTDTFTPDIIVRALVSGVEVARATFDRVAPRLRADLLIGGTVNEKWPGPTRYQDREARLAATGTTIQWQSMGPTHVTFMAGQASMSEAEVQQVVGAKTLNTLIASVPAECFYAFTTRGVGATQDALFAHRLPTLQRMLEDAVAGRVIATPPGGIAPVMTNLQTAGRAALRLTGGNKLRLGTLIDNTPSTSINSTHRDNFLNKVLNHEGTIEELWALVEADGTLPAVAKQQFRFAVEASAISGHYLPMVQALHARVAAATLVADGRELAKYTSSDWTTLVNPLADAPVGTPGANAAARKTNYVTQLLKNAEARYRSARIKARVSQNEAASSPLRKFFEATVNVTNNFEFERHRVSNYLTVHPTALDALTTQNEKDEAKRRLFDIERVFRVADAWDDVSLLTNASLGSAQAIYKLGLDGLTAKVPGLSNPSLIHAKACWQSTNSAAMWAKYAAPLNGKATMVLGDLATPMMSLPAKVADWTALFGSADQCSCEHCESVLSPAAYLVDCIEMLEAVPEGPTSTAKDALLARRPDLKLLALSCENGSTPLPAIDLANEIMEVRLAASTWPSWPTSGPIDTLANAEELAAHPEVLYPTQHQAAYAALAGTFFPHQLPFHLWLEEARTYLDHLGVPRARLIETLAPVAGPNVAELALERLRTSPGQVGLITGTFTPAPQPWEHWGLGSSGWPGSLTPSKLLEKGDLTFDELRECLASTWAWSGTSATVFFPANSSCDLGTLGITGLTEAKANELHRRLRLRRTLGWTITETDIAWALAGTVDEAGLQRIASAKEVATRLGLSPRVAMSLYQEMDRRNAWEPSLFETVYLSKKVTSPARQAFLNLFTGTSDTSTVAEVEGGIVAALSLSSSEFKTLTDATSAKDELGLPEIVPGGERVSLDLLSYLHRVVAFSRATRTSLGDALVLREFSGLNALQVPGASAATPQATLDLIDQRRRLERGGISVSEANYLIRHVASRESGLAPTTTVLETWDAQLLKVVATAAEEARQVEDEDGAIVTSLGELLLKPTPYADTLLMIAGELPGGEAAATMLINDELAPFVGDTGAAISALVTPATKLVGVELRRTFLARLFTRYMNCRSAVLAWVSKTFNLRSDVAAQLLGTAPNAEHPSSLLRTTIDDVGERDFIPNSLDNRWGVPRGSDSERRRLFVLLSKASLLIRKLRLTSVDLRLGGALVVFDLNGLPDQAPGAATAMTTTERNRFSALLRLADFSWVRDRYPAGGDALYTFLSEAPGLTLTAIYDRLAAETGLPRADIQALSERFAVAPAPISFNDEVLLVRIFEAMETLRRLGCSAAQASAWADPIPSDPVAASGLSRDVKSVARARYTDEEWTKIGRDVRDPLRELQRRALVSALLPKTNKANADQLYEHLLIDVQTSPCALTSRLVSAHGSIQTFVNRIQLNLEPGIAPTPQLAEEWDWAHAYRLWEANRKVFLWPENWIEPELRGDKTPLFRKLESALLQAPLDERTVERAYRGYLDGLAEIGNLEIVGLHTEARGFGNDVVHVIGRTPAPHRHFYRKRTTAGWTAWTIMDVDIQSNNVLPVVHSGRLYAFWLEVEDVPLQDTGGGAEAPTRLGATLRLHAATLDEDRWVYLGTSHEAGPLKQIGASPVRERVSLVYELTDDKILVRALIAELMAVRFEFHLGTRQIRWAFTNKVKADQYIGQDGSAKVVQDDTSYLQNPNTSMDGLPAGVAFQHFDALNSKVRAYIKTAEDPIPNAVVLSGVPTTTNILVDRGPASQRELRHMVVQDSQRSFFLNLRYYPVSTTNTQWPLLQPGESGGSTTTTTTTKKYSVAPFSHPWVTEFRTRLAKRGVDGILRPKAGDGVKPQYLTADVSASYGGASQPHVGQFYKSTVNFNHESPYGVYNWELFFHAPFLIANRLSKEGRYAEARRWYHTIFDPTDGTPVPTADKHTRYWKFKPFAENKDLQSIQAELNSLAETQYAEAMLAWADAYPETEGSENFQQQIARWREDPFDPHAIARLRVLAYQKAVVQKYIENLISWGDQLFTQDTMESVNEALQLYVHALQLLGPKPTLISKPNGREIKSYDGLGGAVDAFGNALTSVEVLVPPMPTNTLCFGDVKIPATVGGSTYFCVPQNERLFGYWDTLADRLFKIRHCQNIEGVERTLPLFQPPIDPALLVRARAAGLDLRSVLNDLTVSSPPYRYATLIARAMEYAGAVQSLGSSLLSALEKRDSEHLATLRAGHEVANLELSRQIRKDQVREAKEALAAAKVSLQLAKARQAHYETREFMSDAETEAQELSQDAEAQNQAADQVKRLGSMLALIPNAETGAAGAASPRAVLEFGGQFLAGEANMLGDAMASGARALSHRASIVSTRAGYERREDDWKFQADQSKKEVAQNERHVLAAEIRLAVSEQELTLLDRQLSQSREVESHLRTKFTNEELHGWMAGELSAVYHQSYRLAYEMARRAERAFQVERADTSQTFIRFGAWDGARQGLMAGERLSADLRSMDAAYHSQNRREHELTKTISIAQLDPEAFMSLRNGLTNGAEFSISEKMFDEDFPRHHLRRLRSVNVTLHCSPGPYQSVSGELALLNAEKRLRATDTTTTVDTGIAYIATSTAQQDAGVFELSFQDGRYLPFEYRGAHWDGGGKQWRFKLSAGNEFPYESISDLVLQLRYTAREGRTGTVPAWSTRRALIRVPHTHSDAWAAYKETPATGVVFATKASMFPRGKQPGASTPKAVSLTKLKAFTKGTFTGLTLVASSGSVSGPTTPGAGEFQWTLTGTPESATWTLTVATGSITDLWVAFEYTVS